MTQHRMVDQCLSEQELEDFVFNRLRGARRDAVEQHLLFCSRCQALAENELTFKREFQAAVGGLGTAKPGRRWHWPLIAGLAASLAAAFWLVSSKPLSPRAPGDPVLVSLNLTRGLPLQDAAVAPAGQVVQLSAELAGLPVFERYEVELVGGGGARILRLAVQPARERIEISTGRPLAAGVYWVRLYGGGALLREFALRVK